MKIAGTQYSLEKKAQALELKKARRTVEQFKYKDRIVSEVTDEVWSSLKRKGVTVNKDALKDTIQGLFPGVRRHGPLK